MGLEEFTVQKNTASVEQATSDHTPAQVDDIERRAKAQVIDVEKTSANIDDANTKLAGNSEGQVYGDILLEASGLKMASTVLEFIDSRMSDKSLNEDGIGSSKNTRTIEEDIELTARNPGVYRAPTGAKAYDGVAENLPNLPLKLAEKDGIFSRANIATSSLKEQGKDALKTWDVPEKQNFAGVKIAKEMTFEMRNANDLALVSANAVRQQHSATMHKINQIAPSMGMGSGPSIRPQDLLRDAELVAAEKTA